MINIKGLIVFIILFAIVGCLAAALVSEDMEPILEYDCKVRELQCNEYHKLVKGRYGY